MAQDRTMLGVNRSYWYWPGLASFVLWTGPWQTPEIPRNLVCRYSRGRRSLLGSCWAISHFVTNLFDLPAYYFCKYVCFVEEEYNTGVEKDLAVSNHVEQLSDKESKVGLYITIHLNRLVHSVHIRIVRDSLGVVCETHTKYHRVHTVKLYEIVCLYRLTTVQCKICQKI